MTCNCECVCDTVRRCDLRLLASGVPAASHSKCADSILNRSNAIRALVNICLVSAAAAFALCLWWCLCCLRCLSSSSSCAQFFLLFSYSLSRLSRVTTHFTGPICNLSVHSLSLFLVAVVADSFLLTGEEDSAFISC